MGLNEMIASGIKPYDPAQSFYKAEVNKRANMDAYGKVADRLRQAEQDKITNARNAEKDRMDRFKFVLESNEDINEQMATVAANLQFPEDVADLEEVSVDPVSGVSFENVANKKKNSPEYKMTQYQNGVMELTDLYAHTVSQALDASGFAKSESEPIKAGMIKTFLDSWATPEAGKQRLIDMGLRAEPEDVDTDSEDISDEQRFGQNAVDIFTAENPDATAAQKKRVFNNAVIERRRKQAGEAFDVRSAEEEAKLVKQLEYSPKIEAAKASAKIEAETIAESRKNLPKRIATANEMTQLIDELIEHPGMRQAVGLSRIALIQRMPGTDAYDFQVRLDQINGQTFMEAYETLKGGGQITEIEGQKATEARHRMNASSSEKAFIEASRDYQAIIKKGLNRYRKLAKTGLTPASQKAVKYLYANPEQKEQFKAKYGYLPEDL